MLSWAELLLEPQQRALATKRADVSANPLGPLLVALQLMLREVLKLCSVEDAALILR